MADKDKSKKSIISQKDVLILRELLEDGRKSSSKISKEIDLGREIVNYRIKRLIKENLIVKFIPKINEEIMNYKEHIIFLKLNLEDEISKENFVNNTIGHKYLVWTVKSDSGWDLIVRLYTESSEEFKRKLSEILENFSSVLAQYYTIVSNDEIKEKEKEVLKKKLFNEDISGKDYSVIKKNEENFHQLDSKDREILSLLEENARIQYKEIAEKVNISSDTAKYRIDKMKSQGVIENFTPIINFNKLGYTQYAAIIRFKFLSKEELEKLYHFFEESEFIIKAIKSIYCEEYFLNLLFNNNNEAQEFKEEFCNIFEEKIEQINMFWID